MSDHRKPDVLAARWVSHSRRCSVVEYWPRAFAATVSGSISNSRNNAADASSIVISM